ncbi:uncharacterized protein LOC121075611 isoform X2 [Cygnus olor]|uniref:uncharacterized protein LOC121075611 isoform X2 n=1 Tax=Cygnus olor TaxID=8869 RepID=UPI001ADE39A5|nr:uncharacterized protein LOC121075611 isoform X2 [Cygnus olor]
MSGRPPCSPRAAWLEEAGASPASRPRPQPYEESEVQPLQAPSGSGVGPSASAVLWQEEEDALSFIRACCSRRPEREAQKLRFLASVCDACRAAVTDHTTWDAVYFCQLEVARSIEALLQEEPTDRLDTEVRQKAMLAIAAMSRAGLLPQDRKNGLLRACLCSVFHLPGHEDRRDMDTSLYFKTVEALDSLLQVLVGSAGASGLLELQNILKVWLWQRLGFTHAVSSLPQCLVQAGVPKAGAGPELALARLEGRLGSNGKGAGPAAGQGHGHPPGHRSGGTAGRTSVPCCGHTSSFSPPSSCCPSPSSSRRPWRRGPWRGSPGWPPSSTPAPCPR